MTSGNLVLFPKAPRSVVVDSWPFLEWLKNREPAAGYLERIFESARYGELYLYFSTLNWGETYYNTHRDLGRLRATEFLEELKRLPIELVHPTQADVLVAASLKVRFPVSFADCFAAALAIQLGASVLTGDADFFLFKRAGLLQVDWVGV